MKKLPISVILENNHVSKESFKTAIWPFLAIGQCFGVLPVIGIKNRPISQLEFKWISLRAIYSLILAFVFASYTLLVVYETLVVNVEFSSIGSCTKNNLHSSWLNNFDFGVSALLLFYGINTLGFISFLTLASKWPKLMRIWGNAEMELPTFRNERQQKRFILKIRFFSLGILFLALSKIRPLD